MKLEDSLNGGYKGLYGEVITHDCYRLRQLNFVPDTVFDLGGNVGVFARFAQSLWPLAQIISVEPDPGNIAVYEEHTKGTTLIKKAIGRGELYHNLGAVNGSGEVYISKGLGYPNGGDERSTIATVMPSELIKEYLKPGMKSLLKMDIEGAESAIWGHKPTMAALKKIDYLAFELHYYSATHEGIKEVTEKTNRAIEELRKTHDVVHERIYLWARKK